MASSHSICNIPTRGVITEVLVSKIEHSDFLLRDHNMSLEELIASIAEKGLLHPIIVRPMRERFEVVAGNRRLAAFKQLGWKRIMCHVFALDDKDAFEVSLIENLQHRTLNPVEEAHAYNRYVKEHGWGSSSELARRIGKSHSYVSNRIRLLELPQHILDKIVRRQTNAGTMQEVLAIENEDRRHIFAEEIIEDNLTRQEVRDLMHNNYVESFDCVSNTYTPSQKEVLLHEKEKAMFRFITTLRIALMRLDDTLEVIDQDDWILWQNLMHCRAKIHGEIDELIVLKRKTRIHFDKVRSL